MNILGDGYATVDGEDNSTIRLLEQSAKEEGDTKDEMQTKLALLLIIQQFDMQLMNQTLKKITQWVIIVSLHI